uniref:alpha-1A adrenergic receptor-like n=1 Tax=Myxine glutinosa TaxID=7769 RepID=UPI00358DFCC3
MNNWSVFDERMIWTGVHNQSVENPVDITFVSLALALGSFISFAIVGNILVILSVACNSRLQTVTNYFITNLAIADLLLSIVVLPFSATLEVLGNWSFGRVFCDVWAAVDVLCCTASILSLCIISVDRYIGVSFPLRHPTIMTERRAFFVLVVVWVLSAVISVGPLLGWKESRPEDETTCSITVEPGYTLFSSLGSFYIPMFIILGMYCKVYVAARRQSQSLQAGVKKEMEVTLRIHKRHSDGCCGSGHGPVLRGSLSMRLLKFSREKKAAKTVGIVVGVFVLCWLPFFLVLPLGAYFPQYKPNDLVFKIIFWLGYLNSGINPLIYPFSSQEFKRTFMRLLCCWPHHRWVRHAAKRRYGIYPHRAPSVCQQVCPPARGRITGRQRNQRCKRCSRELSMHSLSWESAICPMWDFSNCRKGQQAQFTTGREAVDYENHSSTNTVSTVARNMTTCPDMIRGTGGGLITSM